MEEKSITGKGKAGWDIMENTNRVTGFEGKKLVIYEEKWKDYGHLLCWDKWAFCA